MNAEEEFERIKKYYKETNNISFEDIDFLIDIVDVLNKKSKQDYETIKHYMNSIYGKQVTESINKVQLSNLYGVHKEIYKNVNVCIDTVNGYFKSENVDVRITDKFVIVEDKKVTTFYDINKIEYFSITQNESEVK